MKKYYLFLPLPTLNLIDYLFSEAEAKHLVFEADIDQDNKLTKEEIIENYDLFVGSQVEI